MKIIIIKTLQLSLFLTLCTGCASTYFTVKVDSINSGASGKNKYVLLSGKKDISEDDLQFQEFSKYTHFALQEKGFVLVDNIENADIATFLFYSLSEPSEHQYSYSLPVYGQTGVSSSQTYGTISSYGNTASYSGTTYNTPSYGVVGSSQHSGTRVTFTRYISLEAIDMEEHKKSGAEKQVWKTTIISTGSSGDLRRVFPVMIGAAKNYIGENTGKKVEINLSETDRRVQEMQSVLLPK